VQIQELKKRPNRRQVVVAKKPANLKNWFVIVQPAIVLGSICLSMVVARKTIENHDFFITIYHTGL
jgi:hypothetical protein